MCSYLKQCHLHVSHWNNDTPESQNENAKQQQQQQELKCNKIVDFYLRTNIFPINVAGKQNTMTKISATARFTIKKIAGRKNRLNLTPVSICEPLNALNFNIPIKKLVTVLIRGDRKTTAITKLFPIKPTIKTIT